jgi:hypothetical protein
MNINASIIDQRITKIIEQHSDLLSKWKHKK